MRWIVLHRADHVWERRCPAFFSIHLSGHDYKCTLTRQSYGVGAATPMENGSRRASGNPTEPVQRAVRLVYGVHQQPSPRTGGL